MFTPSETEGTCSILVIRHQPKPGKSHSSHCQRVGKPSLAEDEGGLRFNLAHSEGAALYAFARGREVGVDVELWRDDSASMDVARRFFSAAEVRALGSPPRWP